MFRFVGPRRKAGFLILCHMPLPVPVPALGVVQRVGGHPLALRAVVLTPRHLVGIAADVDATDMVVLAEVGSMPKVAKGEPSPPGLASRLSPRPA